MLRSDAGSRLGVQVALDVDKADTLLVGAEGFPTPYIRTYVSEPAGTGPSQVGGVQVMLGGDN